MKMIGKDRQVHDIPDHQVQAAFLSGEYGFLPGTSVPVVTQSGDVGQVDAHEAEAAFKDGARVAGAEEYHQAALKAEYGGVKGALLSGPEGFARGASAGLSDPIAIKAAGLIAGPKGEKAARQHLSGTKAANPITSFTGEAAGIIVPTIASGGAAAPEEAAAQGVGRAAAAEATAEVGARALPEAVAARALPEAAEAAPRALEGVAPKALPEVGGTGPRALPEGPRTIEAVPESEYVPVEQGTPAPHVPDAEVVPEGAPGAPEPKLLGQGTPEPAPPAPPAVPEAPGAVPEAPGAPTPGSPPGAFRQAIKAIGAAQRGISAAGEFAEKGIAAALGETSERAFVRVAQKALSKGAGFATEGALYNVGNQLSEDALGDHDTTAEKLFAAAGYGAVSGFLLGGATGAGGELAKYGLSKAAPGITRLAEEEAARSLNPKIKNVTDARTLPGGIRGLGRWLIDNGIVKVGDKVDNIAERTSAASQAAGQRVDAIAQHLDRLGVEGPDGEAMLKRMDRVIKEVRSKPGFEHIANSVEQLRDSFASHMVAAPSKEALAEFAEAKSMREALLKEAGGDETAVGRMMEALGYDAEHGLAAPEPTLKPLSFVQARSWRASLDDLLRIESSPIAKSPRDAELRQIRRIVEDEIEQAADRASKHVGGDVLKEYKAAKLDYRYARTADRIAQKEVDRLTATRRWSPSDYAAILTGALTGHPLAAAAGIAHHYVRERGNATAAVLLDKITDFAAMSRATKDINERIEGSVERFISGEKPKIKGRMEPFRGGGPDIRKTYQEKADEVAAAAMRLPKKTTLLHGMMMRAAPHAPNVARAVAVKATAATKFLADQIPEALPQGIQPQFSRPQLSDADVAKFLRSAQIVENPMSILDELERGTITPEHVHALKTVYPKLYDQLTKRILAQVHEAKTPVPYGKLLQLQMLLGMPVNATTSPQFVATMQATYKKSKGGSSPGQVGPKIHPVQGIAESAQLGLEKAINRHHR